MEIEISSAIKHFFPNSSFEFVYFEAIANAIDANATRITVTNRLKSLKDSASIEVEITDNGDGFTEQNFTKFTRLLKAETPDHKGLGRLVYLSYFNSVQISSQFNGKRRDFLFDETFSGESTLTQIGEPAQQTSLVFQSYKKERLKSYGQVSPAKLKDAILRQFFPILYEKKIKEQNLEIIIRQQIENPESGLPANTETSVDIGSLDELKEVDQPATGLGLFDNLKILYSVKRTGGPSSMIIAICSDGRTIPISPPLLDKSQLPDGYELIFIAYSEFFTGKSDASRQSLNLNDVEKKTLRALLLKCLSPILIKEIPQIQKRNEEAAAIFAERYPHLNGYFEKSSIGILDKDSAIEGAQKKFFADQREILEAVDLDDERYEKSIELSSRLLMEYILYRTKIIQKLKTMGSQDSETEIHNTIVPRKMVLKKDQLGEQLFFNNAWLLDDKYMNFNSILSEVELSKLAKELKVDMDTKSKGKRPDITIVFSSDIEKNDKVDVIVVELKKKNLPLARREEVISQLRQRARDLLLYYPNKIQRVWFYGIVDFDAEFTRSLIEDEFIQLYSSSNLFYKEYEILPDINNRSIKVPTGMFILDYDAFITDAENRNATFLKVLKSRFS